MKKIIKLLTLLVFTVLVSATVVAQNPSDPDAGDPDANVPLDEGLLTVLISGAAIGVSKLIKNRNKNKVIE